MHVVSRAAPGLLHTVYGSRALQIRQYITTLHTLPPGHSKSCGVVPDESDTDEDNKLFLDDAMPFIKRFCKDEMEMDEE